MKNVVILGSTGSIGTQTLDVIERLPERLRAIGLSAHSRADLLRQQALSFGVPEAQTRVGPGADLCSLATLPEADVVVVAVAGAVGLRATLAALQAGKTVALATKEVLVAAGQLVMETARRSGAAIVPIDSEHSAILQCLGSVGQEGVETLWITASGGPFRGMSENDLASVTPDDALRHPTWPTMGKKIRIDSATLMNKGLELIEAGWLFDVPLDRVQIVIHPQSIVHSMVQTTDGVLMAQLGHPDMRHPIQYALLYPDRLGSGLPSMSPLDISQALAFSAVDHAAFPAITIAREAAARGGTAPAVMNAANEAAVDQFLQSKIAFLDIMGLVADVVERHVPVEASTADAVLEADSQARADVERLAGGFKRG